MKTISKIGILLFIFILSGTNKAASVPELVDRNEAVKKESRSVGSFTGIKVGGAFEVFLRQTGTPAVVVEADEEIIPYIITEVEGNVLRVGMSKIPHHWGDVHTLNVYIDVAELNSLEISGAVEISTQSQIKGESMEFDCSGAVEADLNLSVGTMDMELSGACEVTLKGDAQKVNISTSGASELDAGDFSVKEMEIFASGATEAGVNVTGTLKISASGACEINYTGGASVNAHTSGASSVRQKD